MSTRTFRLGLGAVLVLALGLRLLGIRHGLPFVYNLDENAHFVPKAVGMFGHTLNPEYFANPPAYTYLLHVVFAVWFHGRDAVGDAFGRDPGDVYVVARVVTALLGTLAVGLLAAAGARLFGRAQGLLAAALLAVAFLPVFYGREAVNDAPALVPIALALVGIAGVLRAGRRRDYLLAGAAIGLAAATKYTAGIALVPLLGAAAVRMRAGGPPRREAVLLAGALVAAGAVFLLANPFSLIDLHTFREDLAHQSTAAGDSDKLGQNQSSGILYYLWTLTWGLGWVPALAALGGAWILLFGPAGRDRAAAAVLLPALPLYLIYMGLQARWFGRWMLPVYPMLALLAAHAGVVAAQAAARRRPALAPAFAAVAAGALLVQGLATSLHGGLVLTREDTRNQARAWMERNIPPGTRIVLESIVPREWVQDAGRSSDATPDGGRWLKYFTPRRDLVAIGAVRRGELPAQAQVDNYEAYLHPALIGVYERARLCWVITGSTQRGRAENDPQRVPDAIRYYAALERGADRVAVFSPYRDGADPPKFNFDWSFDYYPRAYRRPGPLVEIWRLRGGRCANGAPAVRFDPSGAPKRGTALPIPSSASQ